MAPPRSHVATRFDAVTQSLTALTRSLAVAIPLLGLFVGIISWIVIGRTLRPVEAIRRQVETIATANLDQRVPTGRSDSELGRLATTMNGMLARIESGHHRQQRFVADASHELRSPLTRIRGHLEVDQRTDADRNELLATHSKILDDLTHLESLVDDLLVLARHDEAAPLARTEPVDLDDIILADIAKRRSASSVVFDTTQVSGVEVTGDPKQLARAIRNVVDNAERHANTTVEIHVSEPTPTTAQIIIHDDGPGIPADMYDTVSERFRQADNALSPNPRRNRTRTCDHTRHYRTPPRQRHLRPRKRPRRPTHRHTSANHPRGDNTTHRRHLEQPTSPSRHRPIITRTQPTMTRPSWHDCERPGARERSGCSGVAAVGYR